MTLLPRHIDLFAVLLLVVILVAGGTVSFQQVAAARQRQVLERKLLNQHQTQIDRAKTDLAGLKQVLDQQRQSLAMLAKRIPPAADIGPLLSTVHGRAKERNLTLTGFSHKTAVKTGRYQRVPVQLALEGKFADLYDLIHALETLNRLFIIETLNIERHTGRTGICRATMNASIFFNE